MAVSRPEVAIRVDTRRWTGRDAIFLIVLAAVVMVAFWEVVAGGMVFFFRDFSLFFYPKRVLVAESLRNLQVPFWTQYGGCGEPVLGTWQVAAFYPGALLYYLLPMPASFMWFTVIHFFIAGAGTYYMMRTFGARRAAAGVAAIAWGLSPAFVSVLDYVSFMNSLAWLPWCLACVRRICLGWGPRGFLALVGTFAMALLAGGPEPVVFIGAAVVLYAAFFGMSELLARRPGWWRPAVLSMAALGLALVVSGVGIVPFVHALRWSGRPEMAMEDAGLWAGRPSDGLLLFLPRFYLRADRGGIFWRSQYWLKSVYLGVLVPLLAIWTMSCVRRRRAVWIKAVSAGLAGVVGAATAAAATEGPASTGAGAVGFLIFGLAGYFVASTRKRNIFFALAAMLCLMLAVGETAIIWRIFWRWLPAFRLIRFPVKWFLPAAYAMVVLAGFAVDDALVCARAGAKRTLGVLFAIVLLAALLFGVSSLAMRTWPLGIFTWITPQPILEMAAAGETVAADQAWERFDSAQWSFARSAGFLAAGAAALGLAVFLAAGRVPRPYGVMALAAVFFFDLAMFAAHLNPVAGPELYTKAPARLDTLEHGPLAPRLHFTPRFNSYRRESRFAPVYDLDSLVEFVSTVRGRPFASERELLDWLARTSAPRFDSLEELDSWLMEYRSPAFATSLEQIFMKETFHPNLNLIYRVPVISSFDPTAPRWHSDLVRKLLGSRIDPRREQHLAEMWGAAMVIDVTQEAPGFAYRRTREPPRRVRLVDHFIAVEDDDAAMEVLVNSDVDIRRRIVLLGDAGIQAGEFLAEGAESDPAKGADEPGTAAVIADTGNEVTVRVTAERPALLFMADTWYPNFRARLNGEPVPLWRANLAYRAVPVPAGEHTVRLVYRPTEFYAGLAATAAGLVAMIVIPLLWRGRGGAGRQGV